VSDAREQRRDPSDLEMLRKGFEAVRSGAGYSFDSFLTATAFDPGYAERALGGNVGTAFNNAFADFVVVYERTNTPMLDPGIVTVLPRSSGEPLIIPRVTADPAHGGTVTAEAGGVNELDMTLSQVTITPYKYGITNLWSAELDQDNTIDLVQLMARTTGRELGLDIGDHLTTGSGSSQPKGFITAASNGGTATGTGTTFGTYFGGTDLIALYYKPAAPYRRVGSWMANSTTLTQIRQSRDTTGQLLWQPSYQIGQPESLLGRPIYENPGMANGSAAKAVAFGDFSQYTVIRVNPTRVALSRDYKFSTDQLALRTIERVGGDLPDVASIYFLVNAAV
jgi:HK97 family phage major capsid protein